MFPFASKPESPEELQKGKTIIEEEQQVKERAEYGTYLIRTLSKELKPDYGTS